MAASTAIPGILTILAQPLNVSEAASARDIRIAVTTKYNQVFLLTNQTGEVDPEEHGYRPYFRDTRYDAAGHVPSAQKSKKRVTRYHVLVSLSSYLVV